MKVVSLFDGISCGRVALERAELPVSRYVAFEIDANAINCSKWNWPDIEHRGTVVGTDFSEFAGYDLVMGGFPCTDLSIAKRNRKGLKGEHSSLFWELVRAIREIKPRYFLVENNYGMPKADEAIITETLGVAPILIDSALVSAQRRKRLYWTNIPGVEQPEDRGIHLASVLEARVPKKYYHTSRAIAYLSRARVNCRYIKNPTQQKSHCITTRYDRVPYNVLAVPNTMYQRPRGYCKGRVCAEKAPAVTSSSYERNHDIIGAAINGEYTLRKITPVECERLQTLPDGYTEMLCDTQRYKTLGNGWNVDTVAHILNYINVDMLL